MSKHGSVFGGMLLIAGSCIGAGMLALPVVTGMAGFAPSLFMFFLAALFMSCTALLLVEASSWFDRPVNLLTMVTHTLGRKGRYLCWALYLFLFYALLVAYMALSGDHTGTFLSIPDWVGTIFFVLLFGWIIYLGTKPVDHMNRFLMIGKVVALVILLGFGFTRISPNLLTFANPKYSLVSFPVLIISFGFHNMIPSLTIYMHRDLKRVRKAIIGGALLSIVLYLIWELVVLGILPVGDITAIYKADIDAAQALRQQLGPSWVGTSAQFLAYFAILTSFLAQALSLVHFLRDGLHIHREKREHIGLCALALLPPLVFSILFPQIFFQALDFAGGVCAVALFGIMPVLMVWIGRYRMNEVTDIEFRGGKPLLVVLFISASFIIFYQLTQTFGLNLFPMP